MIVWPFPVCIILSIPLGPKDVRIASATAKAVRCAREGTGAPYTSCSHNVGISNGHGLFLVLEQINRQLLGGARALTLKALLPAFVAVMAVAMVKAEDGTQLDLQELILSLDYGRRG